MNRDGNEITAELIRDLLRDQHPDLAGLPLGPAAKGWANQTWRLGDELAVRLPWMTRDGTDLRKVHGDAGDRELPGGKPTWGPPARESLRRLTASA